MQFLLAVWMAGVAVTAPAIQRSDPVLVRAVFDGDTIDVSTYGRVRLLGIDAPEVSHGGLDTAAPFGREARDTLTSLVLHRWVRLEAEGERRDAYSRHLAYVVREDGLFVNAELVRRGLARVTARTTLARLPELRRAESEAQSFRRGMWGATPAIAAADDSTAKRPRRYTSRSTPGSSKPRKKKKKS